MFGGKGGVQVWEAFVLANRTTREDLVRCEDYVVSACTVCDIRGEGRVGGRYMRSQLLSS